MKLNCTLCCTGGFAADNSLTEAEQQDGWILLFNGKDFGG